MDNLFKVIDYTQEIGPILENINADIQSLQRVLQSEQYPNVNIGQQCEKPRECQFNAVCWKNIPKYSVFNIPRALNKWKLLEEINWLMLILSPISKEELLNVIKPINRSTIFRRLMLY
jgi:hypothetical protein